MSSASVLSDRRSVAARWLVRCVTATCAILITTVVCHAASLANPHSAAVAAASAHMSESNGYDPAPTSTTPIAKIAAATAAGAAGSAPVGGLTRATSARLLAAEETGSLAGRDALGRFTGAGGYGAEAEAQGLTNYELATGQTVIRQQVRASLFGGGPGRFYDGLVRNADGTYTGIEVKSGTASLTPPQRAFDSAVNGGEVARATLNGQPIEITSTELVQVR